MVKGLLRRLRGVLCTAVTWGLGWAGLSVVFGALGGLPLSFIGMYALTGGAAGMIAGGSFAVLLSVVERRHTLADLSLRRVALWGGIGGAVLAILPLAFGMPIGLVLRPLLIDGLLGAGFAAGSVALAKRADDTRLLENGDELSLMLEGE